MARGCGAERVDIAILILAAGASRRMQGRDKLLENVDGMTLLRRQVLRARAATDAPVIVALPPLPHARQDELRDLDVQIVQVGNADDGMNASLGAGLAALPATAKAVMVMLADMPDVTEEDLRTVLDAVDLASDHMIWRATTAQGAPGHPIIFRSPLWPALQALTGDSGGRDIARAHLDRTLYVPLPANHARTDLDTPEAWAAWRAGDGSV